VTKEEMAKLIQDGKYDAVADEILKNARIDGMVLGELAIAKSIIGMIPQNEMKHNKFSAKEANAIVQQIVSFCYTIANTSKEQIENSIKKNMEENKDEQN
jgi:hypothetical protein